MNTQSQQAIKHVPIKVAIRKVLRTAYIAKETHNRELYLECREWLKKHIASRNTNKLIFYTGV